MITASGRIPGVETVGVLVCLDCSIVLDRLPVCGAMTKQGRPCRWVIRPDDGDLAAHPHAAPMAVQQQPSPVHERRKRQPKVTLDPKPRTFISPAESRWLADILKDKGRIEGGAITLEGIKKGQAELIVGRYGGIATGGRHADWRWRCEGRWAEHIIASIGAGGRGE